MAILVTLQSPEGPQKFPLNIPVTILGRQVDSDVCLAAKAVSRQHAQIHNNESGDFYIEDLASSNGTYINGERLDPHNRVLLHEYDTVQIGPYVLALRPEPTVSPTEENLVIRDSISALAIDQSIYGQAPAQKLQWLLEISSSLARTLDQQELVDKLLEQLMKLMPQADRCMLLLNEGETLIVRGQRCRHNVDEHSYPYSRTVVHRALSEGIGILSEDVQEDQRFVSSNTLTSLNLRSLICVPLITQDGKRLGVLQVDRIRHGAPFRSDDLQLLTTVSMQVAIALDNASLHAEIVREERLRQELAVAREIQEGFMPSEFEEFNSDGFQLFAKVIPAREVSGDFYDFCKLDDGRLAFFVGDVSGKGMPAALFMVAVRTLARYLVTENSNPSETLTKLNKRISADNPNSMFVTLAHGIYDPKNGKIVLASAGHHLPIIRRSDGAVGELPDRPGRMLGVPGIGLKLKNMELELQPGDLMAFYTDGYTEAKENGSKEMFGLQRLCEVVGHFENTIPLPACVEEAKDKLRIYTGRKEFADDLTMFLLRRCDGKCPGEDSTKTPRPSAKTDSGTLA